MLHANFYHAPAMAAIHRAAFPPEEHWDAKTIAEQLALTGVYGGIDIDGGMALARLALDEVELLTFAVHPERQGQGIGFRMLRALKDEGARRGGVRMLLEVSVNNAVARRLYERSGFSPIGLRRGYYANGDDATVMEARLSVPPAW